MAPTQFRVCPGVLVAPAGEHWAAFSPASGETHLLNDSAAAVLEVLREGARAASEVATELARDSTTDANEVVELVGDALVDLEDAGLIEQLRPQDGASLR